MFTRLQMKYILQALGLLLERTENPLDYVRIKEIEAKIRQRINA